MYVKQIKIGKMRNIENIMLVLLCVIATLFTFRGKIDTTFNELANDSEKLITMVSDKF